jgi:CMP-N,N'-diacetyllegionaminic acid synthase
LTVNILGLIPARGGSKGIPQKNIVNLAGKPLLAYTCEAAKSSKKLDRIVLNTDDQKIARVGQEYGVEIPFYRPSELAGDETPILPVIQHTLKWFEDNESVVFDVIVLLQPTSPLRRGYHIDAAIDLMMESQADTVVSVRTVPHNFNPVSLMKLRNDGFLEPWMQGEMILRRQDKPEVFARNGPAILAVRRSVIDSGRLYGDSILPLTMSAVESLDIDDENDLLMAEAIISLNKGRN